MRAVTAASRGRNLALLIASTLTIMAGAAIAPAMPDIVAAFDDDPWAVWFVPQMLTITGLAIALSSPLIGYVLDRRSKKRVLAVSLLICGLSGCIGYFWSDSWQVLIASRLLLGAAVAGVMVSCTALLSSYYSGAARNRMMGLQAAFGGYGGVVFLALGGVLADIHWTWPFLLFCLAFPLLPVVLLTVTEPSSREALPTPLKQAPAGNAEKRGLVILCYVLGLGEMLLLYAILLHFPFQARAIGEASATEIGLATGAMMLVTATVAANYSVLKRELSHAVFHALGFFVLACGLLVLAWAESLLWASMALLLSGLGFGLVRPNTMVWLLSVAQAEQRGRVIGGITACFFIGQFLAAPLTLPLFHRYGFGAGSAWLGCALLLSGGALLIGRLVVRQRARSAEVGV
ncbi:hypothetical protein CAI21_11170 [Alkalilimnicola ehrlichii]|uniref:Major facilitator superfamily (MFS) profile domain-containing protein n=1 Tax=Alkalilimnicola ehrlichii TaxID=351052 RepID=A0A3E0X2B4_9GAMM|nr:MFS transporter [Alkalilimnicola ehrlichii]RFA29004.1 hypothetical protein CAI21_11170 [Alkalilimnicola ehrlichii]RFA38640.1 hypothetical protein CAL65_04720 [Alkalilimnicola ehrlichii]